MIKPWNINNIIFFLYNLIYFYKKKFEILLIIIANTKLNFYINHIYFLLIIKKFILINLFIKKINKKKFKFIINFLYFTKIFQIYNFYYSINYRNYIINILTLLLIKYNNYNKNFKNLLIITLENLVIYIIGIYNIIYNKNINILYEICGNYMNNNIIKLQYLNGYLLFLIIINNVILFKILNKFI